MEITEQASKKGIHFADLVYANNSSDIENIIDLFHEHFLNSKNYLKKWHNHFNHSAVNRLKELKVSNTYIRMVEEALSFEMVITKNNYSKIEDIILNNNKKNILIFNKDNFVNSYKLILDYNQYFLSKHLYSIFKNLDIILDSIPDNFNFSELFSLINSRSLNGSIFIPSDKSVFKFKIPLNICTNFMFWSKGNLVGIDTSICHKFDKSFLLNNFTILHLLYRKTPKEIQDNLKKVQLNNTRAIFNKISNDKVIDYQLIKNQINSNVIYILDLDINYEYESFSYFKIIASYLISLEVNKLYGLNVPPQLNNIIFNEVIESLRLSHVIDKKFREDLLVDIFSSFRDYNTFIFNLTILPKNSNFIKDIMVNNFDKFYEDIQDKNLNEYKVKNYLFSYGINNKDNRDAVYNYITNKSILNNKDFISIFSQEKNRISDVVNLLITTKINSTINSLISSNIKDQIIIDKVIAIDSNYNIKKLQKQIDSIREAKEMNRIKDLNLSVKK